MQVICGFCRTPCALHGLLGALRRTQPQGALWCGELGLRVSGDRGAGLDLGMPTAVLAQ